MPPLYKELTVDEYLRFAARLHRVPRASIRQAVTRAKRRCGIEDVGERLIGSLSKGYQQSVGIAQAIVHEPDVVILDEPTVGLDPNQIREIRTLIGELRDRHSVILSTHILPEVEAVCDRVEILHQGAIVYSDTIEALRRFRGGQALRVGLRRTPPLEQSQRLPGVASAEAAGDFVRVLPRDGQDPADAIVRVERRARLGSALSRSRGRQPGGRVRAADHGGAPSMILTIAGKELRRLFTSPLAWVILAFLQLILAWIFLSRLQSFLELQPQIAMMPAAPGFTEIVVAPVFGTATIVLLMVVPLLSMRLIAEERRNQTLPFLMSAPVSITQIVLGKFLGLLAFLSLAVGLLVVMAVSLYAGGKLDLGLLVGNVLGLLLLCGSFAAVGLYLSCLDGAASGSGCGHVRGAARTVAGQHRQPTIPTARCNVLSLIKHYETFAKGTLALNDVVYYLVLIALVPAAVHPPPGRRPAAHMKASARLQFQLLIQNGIFAVLLVAAAVLIVWLLRDSQHAVGSHPEPAQHAVQSHAGRAEKDGRPDQGDGLRDRPGSQAWATSAG